MEFNKSKENKLTRSFTHEEVETIKSMYDDKSSQTKIARHFKTRVSNISYILKELGFEKRYTSDYYTSTELGNRKYTLNQSFFENIDTQQKAYWLGFMYADGCVIVRKGKTGNSKGATIQIALKREDDYHLRSFIRDLKGDMELDYPVAKLNNKEYEVARLSFGSIQMANDLIKHGCTPRKSLTLDYPETVPDELMSHFIRGYFDGDGSYVFSVTGEKDYLTSSVMGTEVFLKKLKTVLNENEINIGSIYEDKRSNAVSLTISGRENIALLYNYLYKDANVYLGRKADKLRDSFFYFDIDYDSPSLSKRASLMDANLVNLKDFRDNIRPFIKAGTGDRNKVFKELALASPQRTPN